MILRNAVTLVELVVVLCILAALSGIVVPLCSNQMAVAAQTATQSTLTKVQQAMLDYWHDTKLVTLDGVITFADEPQRFQLDWLFKSPVTNNTLSQFDPNLRRGWNGPYLIATNIDSGGPELVDAWNNGLVVQYVNPTGDIKDVRIVSPGPNGIVEIPSSTATSSLTSGSIGDDLYVALTLR